ncbi:DUF2487 family protein [Salinicoccus halodurans]|uniref:DUF2487 family protein n=1 Tax=Salinicoccus halodurans TaxID=407035 RepID=UPI001F169EAA|nr:DUF2487 family protein [Salinicoccus halodurans]
MNELLYNQKDLKVLKDEIEFIDTVIIPFAAMDMDMKAPVHAGNLELLQIVCVQLEKQFKGRLLITPPMMTVGEDTSLLGMYTTQLREYGFKNIIVLTHLQAEPGDMNKIRLNEIPLENMSDDMKMEMINDEVKTVMKSVISIWNQ